MKNSEIHNGLDNKEIRDFLSISTCKVFDEENQNKKVIIPYDGNDSLEWCIRDYKAHIVVIQKSIDNLLCRQAIARLITLNGWQEFDVSDETTRDLQYSLTMNFIGTELEHKELLNKIRESK